MEVRPTAMLFEERYSDDSGVNYLVGFLARECYPGPVIRFQSEGGSAEFPEEKLDWLISCLHKIESEISRKDGKNERQMVQAPPPVL